LPIEISVLLVRAFLALRESFDGKDKREGAQPTVAVS